MNWGFYLEKSGIGNDTLAMPFLQDQAKMSACGQILRHGLWMFMPDRLWTSAIHVATIFHLPDMVGVLIANGFNPDFEDIFATYNAVRSGSEKIVKLLSETKKVDANHFTHAAFYFDLPSIKSKSKSLPPDREYFDLVAEAQKTYIDLRDALKQSALYLATESRNETIVKLLLDVGNTNVFIAEVYIARVSIVGVFIARANIANVSYRISE
jgi:hypothetical protein